MDPGSAWSRTPSPPNSQSQGPGPHRPRALSTPVTRTPSNCKEPPSRPTQAAVNESCLARILFTVDGEGEQGVSGIDVHRAVHDRRSAVIQGAAARFDPVLGLKIPGRVEVPQDLAVDGRICTQMPVHR